MTELGPRDRAAGILGAPPTQARAFHDEDWWRVAPLAAIDGLLHLAQALARLHDAGLELNGLNREDLKLDPESGEIYLAQTPRVGEISAARDPGTPNKSVWRDARLVGELAYEYFMREQYPGGHQLAELLQEREAMAELGLLQPGLTQLVAACVSPYGDLALQEMSDLARALEHFRREVDRPLSIRVGSASTLGNYIFRRNNQDSCAYLTMRTSTGSQHQFVSFFCVADGIGGISDGERASQLAVQAGCRAFGRALNHYGGEYLAKYPGDFARAIVQITSERLALQGEFDPDNNRGGTTFTCMVLAADRVGVGHAGDSRALLVRDGRLLSLTREHTLATILKDLGQSSTDPSRAESNQRTISRFLSTAIELDPSRIDGFSPEFSNFITELDPSTSAELIDHIGFRARPGDLFLLSSDGVHDVVEPTRLRQLIALHDRAPQALADAIINQVLEQVGRDNATVVAILAE